MRIWVKRCLECGEDTFGELLGNVPMAPDLQEAIDRSCSVCGARLSERYGIEECASITEKEEGRARVEEAGFEDEELEDE